MSQLDMNGIIRHNYTKSLVPAKKKIGQNGKSVMSNFKIDCLPNRSFTDLTGLLS